MVSAQKEVKKSGTVAQPCKLHPVSQYTLINLAYICNFIRALLTPRLPFSLLIAGASSAGSLLQLNPDLKRAIRLAGNDNLFFIACGPREGQVEGTNITLL